MNDLNNVGKTQNSESGGQIKWFRRPKRLSVFMPVTQIEAFNSRRTGLSLLHGSKNDEAELLNILHQELKDINEGMIRTNNALFELITEIKLLRRPVDENPIS